MVESRRGPDQLVIGSLSSMEARDTASAKACTAPGFTMQFPGEPSFTDFAELIKWSRQRYASVHKAFDRFDVGHRDGTDVVYISGTFSGTWLDNTTFNDIRYLDCFDIQDGRIMRQVAWNDMGEARLARSVSADIPVTRIGAL